jgi:hypothetical protein
LISTPLMSAAWIGPGEAPLEDGKYVGITKTKQMQTAKTLLAVLNSPLLLFPPANDISRTSTTVTALISGAY